MELDLKILASEILNPEVWKANIYHIDNRGIFAGREEEFIRNKVNICLLALRKDWTAKLQDRGFVITEPTIPTYIPQPNPADYISQQNYKEAFDEVNLQNKELEDAYLEEKWIADLAFAELVFAQPDYQSQAQKQSKTPAQLLQEAKEKKIRQLDIYKEIQFAKPLLVRASNGSGNPDYYLKPSPEYNIFQAGHSMGENDIKVWRAFDINGVKILKEDGDPLTLNVTKTELVSVSSHYELRKSDEYNQRDLKVARIGKLLKIEEVEAFDVTQIIV